MPITEYYDDYDENYFWDIVENGITIKTSGSSGIPKSIYQSPDKIFEDYERCIKIQDIDNFSDIYTCLDLKKAGGLFAQTIPALLEMADVTLAKFNPYEYVRRVESFTHSHLTPKQAKAVLRTKGFKKLNLIGHTFLVGSEPVTYDIITAFVATGAKVILIWGMTEIGPNAIMHIFNNMDEVRALEAITPPNSTPLGNIITCEVSIINNELHVRGDQCVYDDWFNTKDTVIEKDGHLFYTGRSDTTVDFNNPSKG